jgi:hypothetical protein
VTDFLTEMFLHQASEENRNEVLAFVDSLYQELHLE